MADEDRWIKLEQVVEKVLRRVLGDELESRGFKPKTKLSFSNGKWVGVTEEQLEAWKLAYPSVNIQQQLQLAAAWIVSNPTLAPKSNYPRFLNTWLTRQQNQASLHAIPTARSLIVKNCVYCERPAVGSTNGYDYCREHQDNAMDCIKPAKAA